MSQQATGVNTVYYEGRAGIYRFCAVAEDILRCVHAKTRTEVDSDASLLVDKGARALHAPLAVEENDETLCLATTRVRLVLDKATESFTWYDAETGRLLLRQPGVDLHPQPVTRYTTGDEKPVVDRVKTVDGERSFIRNLRPYIERDAYRARLHFDWQPHERLYGLGQGEEGIADYRGHNQYLYQHNMRIPMPFLVSSAGWGVWVDCPGLMTFNDDHNGSYLFLDTVDRLDFYFLAGGADDIVAGYRTLTGRAAMLPKWAFGYVQSKEAYRTAEELLEVVEEYRRRGVGLDCVVQDWNTWPAGLWGDKHLDEARYANMPAVAEKIHALNAHTMVSVWPNMAEGGSDHAAFAEKGWLLADYSTYDAFNEQARHLYWQQAREGLYDKGFDSWWCDSTEPFSGPDWGGPVKREPWERFTLVGGEHKKYLDPARANAFALQHAKGIYENTRQDYPEKRVLNLTRSGYSSQQKYGAVLWSGDIYASWQTMRQQINEGLQISISGMPYWTLDIGAFFVVGSAWQKRGCGNNTNPDPLWFWQGEYNDGVGDKGYCELYTRWFQYGTFLPMQRSHGTDTPREIWQFGEKGTPFYDVIEKYIALRYALMPYIYSLAGWTTQSGYTMLRSLLFDFANDETALQQQGAYMFGPAFLVYPVTKPMYYAAESQPLNEVKQWPCYLPAGTRWHSFWTGEVYEGGQTVAVDAPLDTMPLFVRAGSIIPQTPGIQHAGETPAKPMELHIYPGADGRFTLYEDSGEGYGYENGEFSEIELAWQDGARTLQIGARRGSWPGMQQERDFTVICGEKRVLVHYDGQEQAVRL